MVSVRIMHGDAENQTHGYLTGVVKANRAVKAIFFFFCEKTLKTKPPNFTKLLLFTSHVGGCPLQQMFSSCSSRKAHAFYEPQFNDVQRHILSSSLLF